MLGFIDKKSSDQSLDSHFQDDPEKEAKKEVVLLFSAEYLTRPITTHSNQSNIVFDCFVLTRKCFNRFIQLINMKKNLFQGWIDDHWLSFFDW